MQANSETNRIARIIFQAASPERVILFGSHAKGSAHRHSDFDLALVYNSKNELRRGLRLANKALWPRSHPVDLIALTTDSIEKGSSILAREIKSSGRVLCDRAAHAPGTVDDG